jgi:hypothetical protein
LELLGSSHAKWNNQEIIRIESPSETDIFNNEGEYDSALNSVPNFSTSWRKSRESEGVRNSSQPKNDLMAIPQHNEQNEKKSSLSAFKSSS